MSKVIEAWDNADFEGVGALKLSLFKRKDILTAIRESRYASRLIKIVESQSKIVAEGVASGPLKVVTILHSSLPHHTGGYTGRAQGLLHGLAELGIEIRAYTRPGFFSEKAEKKADFPFPVDNVDGVEYRHLPSDVPRGRGEFEYMVHCVDWYREIINIERPNVLHVRSTYLIALPAMIAAHELGIPVLYEVSGLWELVFEGRGEKGRACRTQRMEDLVCQHADSIVSMNSSMAALLSERSGIPLEIGLVPNAVDASKFKEVPPLEAVEKFEFDVGYVGSLVDYEGLDTLIAAVALAREQGVNIHAKVVGKGAELQRLKKTASEKGVEDLVLFHGPVSADAARRQFDDVNVIVLPRKRTPATENVTPLKPFEAMAAGRPLLVSNVAALEEVSRGGQVAEVFESGNATDLVTKLITLLKDRAHQRKLVDEALRIVQTENNWELVAKTMESELRRAARPVTGLPQLPGKTAVVYGGKLAVVRES